MSAIPLLQQKYKTMIWINAFLLILEDYITHIFTIVGVYHGKVRKLGN
jgi:hypothetical protein